MVDPISSDSSVMDWMIKQLENWRSRPTGTGLLRLRDLRKTIPIDEARLMRAAARREHCARLMRELRAERKRPQYDYV